MLMLYEEAGCVLLVASKNKSVIAKWRSVEFFFQLYIYTYIIGRKTQLIVICHNRLYIYIYIYIVWTCLHRDRSPALYLLHYGDNHFPRSVSFYRSSSNPYKCPNTYTHTHTRLNMCVCAFMYFCIWPYIMTCKYAWREEPIVLTKNSYDFFV